MRSAERMEWMEARSVRSVAQLSLQEAGSVLSAERMGTTGGTMGMCSERYDVRSGMAMRAAVG